jgi:hypothetical protein
MSSAVRKKKKEPCSCVLMEAGSTHQSSAASAVSYRTRAICLRKGRVGKQILYVSFINRTLFWETERKKREERCYITETKFLFSICWLRPEGRGLFPVNELKKKVKLSL